MVKVLVSETTRSCSDLLLLVDKYGEEDILSQRGVCELRVKEEEMMQLSV